MVVLAGNMFYLQRKKLVALSARYRLPTAYGLIATVEEGGLMAYGPDTEAHYRQAVTYIDRIIRGSKPGDLPIEQPTKLLLVINLKTAKALGLTIPPALLQRADQVIE